MKTRTLAAVLLSAFATNLMASEMTVISFGGVSKDVQTEAFYTPFAAATHSKVVAGGGVTRTVLAGQGRQAQYGPFRFDAETRSWTLTLSQHARPSPGQPHKLPVLMPVLDGCLHSSIQHSQARYVAPFFNSTSCNMRNSVQYAIRAMQLLQ